MAVFTTVDTAQAAALCAQLGVGELRALKGISAGIENTNYFVDTSQGRWVLTLFERLGDEQLPFYLRLMQHLAQRGLPVPEPRANAQGQLVHHVAGKPAALVNALRGQHLAAPASAHCAQLGHLLGLMHLAVADFNLLQPNLRGLPWWLEMAPKLQPYLGPEQNSLLTTELAYQQNAAASTDYAALPRGAVHADLFCDNVLFDGPPGQEQLSGCLDFYFAGVDTLVYDLAVCLNDWCITPDSGALDTTRAQALVQAYQQVRPLQDAELALLPVLLRAAALRFWMSRLGDWHLPRPADLLAPKDPVHFERILRARIADAWQPTR